MQHRMVFAGDIDETLRESFAAFQNNPLNSFKISVRRTRGAQLRHFLSDPDAIDLQKFLHEVWNIESKTYLHSHNIDLRIFDKPTMFTRSVEQLLDENVITLEELESALAKGDL